MACVQQDLDDADANDVENPYYGDGGGGDGVGDGDNNMSPVRQNASPVRRNVHSLSPDETCHPRWAPNVSPLGLHSKPIGWMDGLLGCMRPVMSLLVKSNAADTKQKIEEWEIPFEHITNLEWLGSGAQGTVFSGYLRNEIVAVKKVRDYKETDIKHLRKLDHENIIKFK